jgi:hypothetical protein
LGNHLEREIVGEFSIDGKRVLESILEKKKKLKCEPNCLKDRIQCKSVIIS